ncbi:MAG: AraC family transcriptional regulator [Bacteroidota bacterium]
MRYTFHERGEKAVLRLFENDSDLHHEAFQERSKPYTVAWNRGPAQTVLVDDIPHEVGQGDLVILVVNQTFSFENPLTVTAWQFNREFYCIVDHDKEVSCVGFIFYGLPSPMVIKLDEKEQQSFELLLRVFIEEFNEHDSIQGEMLRMLLKRLIIKVTRRAKEQHLREELPDQEYDLLREFNLLVELNYKEYHQVQDYATLLHRSPKTLSNLFKKAGAKSPLKIIQERVALEGKRLLLYTDKDIAEVAYEAGFHEASHFSRFFKKMTGMAPGAFRAAGNINA